MSSPDAAFHKRTVLSLLPLATVEPSGDQATDSTQLVWPLRTVFAGLSVRKCVRVNRVKATFTSLPQAIAYRQQSARIAKHNREVHSLECDMRCAHSAAVLFHRIHPQHHTAHSYMFCSIRTRVDHVPQVQVGGGGEVGGAAWVLLPLFAGLPWPCLPYPTAPQPHGCRCQSWHLALCPGARVYCSPQAFARTAAVPPVPCCSASCRVLTVLSCRASHWVSRACGGSRFGSRTCAAMTRCDATSSCLAPLPTYLSVGLVILSVLACALIVLDSRFCCSRPCSVLALLAPHRRVSMIV